MKSNMWICVSNQSVSKEFIRFAKNTVIKYVLNFYFNMINMIRSKNNLKSCFLFIRNKQKLLKITWQFRFDVNFK